MTKVYKISNSITSKLYIGITDKELPDRLKEHSSTNETLIGRAIQQYGVLKFSINLIDLCSTRAEAKKKESEYIHLYNTLDPNGYNEKS
ncbi:MAG: GIY-YIG nuclease family protein [Candidatus Spechtbacteria bacterium SB0662_bin_43]|uniref:GIY-YIG nuclease family protein n=1 Tax=Candidatus Spechtbacteria bacterium SB0662_bin_43 TaxID=2604897 RepID=A0A845DEM2_9BACT|nr:GIY-YIG nuclease family protein [Candidatus Spechtbacteria bacterium SB0662_bin_43]